MSYSKYKVKYPPAPRAPSYQNMTPHPLAPSLLLILCRIGACLHLEPKPDRLVRRLEKSPVASDDDDGF
eukprot:scaffold52902_cov71-Phaeocystis_antarctica.AAC.1